MPYQYTLDNTLFETAERFLLALKNSKKRAQRFPALQGRIVIKGPALWQSVNQSVHQTNIPLKTTADFVLIGIDPFETELINANRCAIAEIINEEIKDSLGDVEDHSNWQTSYGHLKYKQQNKTLTIGYIVTRNNFDAVHDAKNHNSTNHPLFDTAIPSHETDFSEFIHRHKIISYGLEPLIQRAKDFTGEESDNVNLQILVDILQSYREPRAINKQFSLRTASTIYKLLNQDAAGSQFVDKLVHGLYSRHPVDFKTPNEAEQYIFNISSHAAAMIEGENKINLQNAGLQARQYEKLKEDYNNLLQIKNNLQNNLQLRDQYFTEQLNTLKNRESALLITNKEQAEALVKFKEIENKQSEFYNKIQSLSHEVDTLKTELTTSLARTATLTLDNKKLTSTLSQRDGTIATQKTELSQRDKTIATQKTELSQRDQTIAAQKTELSQRDKTIAAQKTELSQRDQTIATQKTELSQRNEALAERKTAAAKLMDTVASQNDTIGQQESTILSQGLAIIDLQNKLNKSKEELNIAKEQTVQNNNNNQVPQQMMGNLQRAVFNLTQAAATLKMVNPQPALPAAMQPVPVESNTQLYDPEEGSSTGVHAINKKKKHKKKSIALPPLHDPQVLACHLCESIKNKEDNTQLDEALAQQIHQEIAQYSQKEKDELCGAAAVLTSLHRDQSSLYFIINKAIASLFFIYTVDVCKLKNDFINSFLHTITLIPPTLDKETGLIDSAQTTQDILTLIPMLREFITTPYVKARISTKDHARFLTQITAFCSAMSNPEKKGSLTLAMTRVYAIANVCLKHKAFFAMIPNNDPTALATIIDSDQAKTFYDDYTTQICLGSANCKENQIHALTVFFMCRERHGTFTARAFPELIQLLDQKYSGSVGRVAIVAASSNRNNTPPNSGTTNRANNQFKNSNCKNT